MFCCNPQHIFLSIAKCQLDFNNIQLYSKKFTEVIKDNSTKHALTKLSSLKIGPAIDYQFKIGAQKHAQFLFELCDSSKQIHLINNHTNPHNQQLWRVLGQKDMHSLNIGDCIRIGYTQMMVYAQKHLFQQKEKQSVQLNSLQHCRYCLLNTYTNEDPLLNICKCNGSVKYLHLNCLRNWTMTKLQQEERDHAVVYIARKMQCQICKAQWPKKVFINGKYEGLLNFQTTIDQEESYIANDEPYIVLQTDTLDEEELQIKVFIKIFLGERFYFGDSESSNLALETIGVSPIHCYLHMENNQYYITDCGSVTGTLVTLHDEEAFTNKTNLYLQCGHLLFKIQFEQPFFSCLVAEEQYRLKYRSKQ